MLGVYWGDPLLCERALAKRLAAFGPGERRVLWGDEPCLGPLVEELRSLDLFSAQRVIVVRRADPLKDEPVLVRTLGRGLPPGLGVFFLGQDLRGPLARQAQEALGFPTPKGGELKALARILLEEAGVQGPDHLVDLLVEACGGETLRLAQEVGKLAVWGGRRLSLDQAQRLLVLSQPLVYPYLDALGRGQTGPALNVLRELLRRGWSAPALFFMVVRHIRDLLMVLGARAEGRPAPGPDWLVRRRLDQAQRWGEARLVELLVLAQELDVKVKTGRLSAEAALQLLTLAWAPA